MYKMSYTIQPSDIATEPTIEDEIIGQNIKCTNNKVITVTQ
jgi:hypothetical protein